MTDGGVPELTPAAVIAAGGWHPAYAVVVGLRQLGNLAVAVVAGNGPGYEMEAEVWVAREGRWSCGITGGLAPGSRLIGWSAPGVGYVVEDVGGDGPPAFVVTFQGRTECVPVNEHGILLWACRTDDLRADDVTVV